MEINSCPACNSGFTAPVDASHRHSRGRQTLTKCPLLLKCGHTFCEACMFQFLKKRNIQQGKSCMDENEEMKAEITCPICKTITCVPSGVKDLPGNLYLTACIGLNQGAQIEHQLNQFVPMPAKKLIQKTLDSRESEDLKCVMCGIKKATCECKECDNILCPDCFKTVHQLSAAIRHHKPVLVAPKKDVQKEATCKEHGKPIEYFCTMDNTSICSRCYITGDHKQHPIVSFEAKNKVFVEQIQEELPITRAVLTNLKKIDKAILSAMPIYRSETKATIDKIHTSFVNLHALFQAREMELVDSVIAAYNKGLQVLEGKRVTFEMAKCSLESNYKEAKNLCENNALVVDAENLLEKLRDSKEMPCVMANDSPSESKCLKWQEKGTPDLLLAIRDFGHFEADFSQKMNFKTAMEANVEPIFDNDTESVSSLSSVMLSMDVLRSTGALSRSCSIATNDSGDTGDDVVLDEDTDGDTCSTRSSNTSRPKLMKEAINMPIVKGSPQKVVLAHINSPSNFCVQLVSNKKKLQTLSHNMNIWCRSASSLKHIPLTMEVNMLVLAKYSADKQWYRAKVLSVEDPADSNGKAGFQIHVIYIDFGNLEKVGIKDVRTMQDRFMYYPAFRVQCCLSDVAPYDENSSWDAESIHEFHKLTSDKVLLMNTLIKTMDGIEVDLTYIPTEEVFDDLFVSVRDVLIFLELGRLKHHSDQAKNKADPPSYTKSNYISATILKSGTSVEVDVCQASSPWDFHIRAKGDESSYYITMMEQMQILYKGDSSNIYSLHYPRPGVLCVAQWEDGRWYRAKVLSAPAKRLVKVFLVDVGETVTVHYDRLKKIHSDFVKLAVQAVNCRLKDVCPTDESETWSSEAQHWCRTVMATSCGRASFIRWGTTSEIVLRLGRGAESKYESSINVLLVEAGLANSSGPASVSTAQDLRKTLPSHPVNDKGPQNYPVGSRRSRESSSSSHSTITSPQKASESSTPVSSPNKMSNSQSLPTSADKPDRVTRDKKRLSLEKTANTQNKENLKFDKPKNKKSTKVSQKKPATVQKEREESPSAEVKAANKKAKVQEDIHRAVCVEAGTNEEDSQKQTMYIKVIMSHFVSPSNFSIRIKENEMQLQQLMTALQSSCSKEEISTKTWVENTDCAVRSSKDMKWYRGNIKKITEPDTAEVELVDYGRLITVSISKDLQTLSPEFCKTQCAAIKCFMADLVPTGTRDIHKWSSTAADFMSGHIFEKNLYVKLIGEPSDYGVPVDIIIEETIPETAFQPASHNYSSLRHLILEEGLAMPNKHHTPVSSPDSDKSNPFERTLFSQESVETVLKNEDTEGDTKPEDFKVDSYSSATKKGTSSRVPQPLCLPDTTLPAIGSKLGVVPTYVGHDGVIYCQPVDWENYIYDVQQELNRIYQDSKYRVLSWQKDQLCVAQFTEDNAWYRASIIQIKGLDVEVLFIDYGNTAWVPMTLLREMCPEFATQHLLALRCVLHEAEPNTGDGVWPTPILTHLHELVVNFQCVITVQALLTKESLVLVTLVNDEGTEFPEYLFSKNLASNAGDISLFYKRSAAIGPVLTTSNPYTQLEMSDLGTEFRATVTHVELPNLVYLQRLRIPESEAVDIVSAGEVAEVNNQLNEFEAMADNLNRTKSMPFATLPDVGLKCAGKFSVDNCWYRAVCVERYPATGSCLLVYVDFGTAEEVPLSNIRVLPTEFWTIPAQAIRCYFNIIPPHGNIFQTATLIGVVQTLTNKELIAKVKQTSPMTVELLEQQGGELRLAYEDLITNGLALLPAQVDAASLLATSRNMGDIDECQDVVPDSEDEEEEVQSSIISSTSPDKKNYIDLGDTMMVSNQSEAKERQSLNPEDCVANIVNQESSSGESSTNEGTCVDWFECTGDGDVHRAYVIDKKEETLAGGDQ